MAKVRTYQRPSSPKSQLVRFIKTAAIALSVTPLLAAAEPWSLETASAPYRGATVDVVFLSRPGYLALEKMVPEFERRTGIEINLRFYEYESALALQIRDFVSNRDIDVALVDLVWLGTFSEGRWLVPIENFTSNPNLTDPDLDLPDFFPLVLDAFGAWDGVQYGLPFDNYSGILYYNRCILEEAGFDGPPTTWHELRDVYGPALTTDEQYAFALQSAQNETQSADSFARFLWPFGGSFLTDDYRSNLASEASLNGLRFRQSLLPFMPSNITRYDHADVVGAFVQGEVAMITEWTAFIPIIAESPIADCFAIAPEPLGPSGRRPALGGFSLAVTSHASTETQAAAWLFIQWATSKAVSVEYLENGGVPARRSTYANTPKGDRLGFAEVLVESWGEGVPEFRPRFSEWTIISPIVQEWGVAILDGVTSVEEGAQQIGNEINRILEDAGYHDGSKRRAQ